MLDVDLLKCSAFQSSGRVLLALMHYKSFCELHLKSITISMCICAVDDCSIRAFHCMTTQIDMHTTKELSYTLHLKL